MDVSEIVMLPDVSKVSFVAHPTGLSLQVSGQMLPSFANTVSIDSW